MNASGSVRPGLNTAAGSSITSRIRGKITDFASVGDYYMVNSQANSLVLSDDIKSWLCGGASIAHSCRHT